MNPYIGFVLILLAWTAVCAVRIKMMLRTPIRTPVLCGYHAAAELRPGMLAIIDGKRCDHCRHEVEHHL